MWLGVRGDGERGIIISINNKMGIDLIIYIIGNFIHK